MLQYYLTKTFLTVLFFSVWGGMVGFSQVNQEKLRLHFTSQQRSIYISPYDFTEMGDWKIEGAENALQLATLTGRHHKRPKDLKPATVEIAVEQEGNYALWLNSLDYQNNQQGARYFYVACNGMLLDKRLGNHGKEGFHWELADLVYLKKGINRFQLADSSAFYERCDGLFLTKDMEMTTKQVSAESQKSGSINFEPNLLEHPIRLSPNTKISDTVSLENDKIKLVFYQLIDGTQRQVESEIFVDGKCVKSREDLEGLVLLRAKESQLYYDKGFPIFRSTILDKDGNARVALGKSPYSSYQTEWLTPVSVEQLSDGAIKLIYQDGVGIKVESTYTLLDHAQEPVVKIKAVAEEEGVFSFIIPSSRSLKEEEYTFALAPMRVTNKKVHPEPVVYTEQYLFTPMAAVTSSGYNSKKHIESELTTGFTVDPSSVSFKWTYNWNSEFGAMLRNEAGKISPALIAPLPGTEVSRFIPDKVYEFTYRPLYRFGGWYDTYKHVAQTIFNLKDYRSNYYTSLNEAIFNTTKLMNDDYYGGWDRVGKAHWNMEGRSFTSNANPMQAVQSYLLSEADSLLQKRAVPTLVNLLTRGHLHFKSDTLKGGANYFGGNSLFPRPIGQPIAGYNASVFAGLYEMTGRRMPVLLNIAEKKSKQRVVNAYGSIPPFVNHLTAYKLTGNRYCLDTAIIQAHDYISEQVYSKNTEPVDYSAFSYISYVPNIASLIDIFEITKDTAFLDAAVEAGHILLTQLWVSSPVDLADSILIKASEVKRQPFMDAHDFFWHGKEVWRPGSKRGVKGPPQNLDSIVDEKVPSWLPSRVGLGLEQPSTFFNESLNMIMSSWAGDLMKLYGYTGDESFKIAARNAIIGRFSNYPGYYQNRFITFQQRADYPYRGPDFTSVYWHHIPPFLAMLEDFLFAQTWAWSKKQIVFPSLRQQGYAYFNSNHYGHAPGTFFGDEGMWPWLDSAVISTDNMQIDWLAARKDGVVGVALMNESTIDIKTQITLGAKVDKDFTGQGTLYYVDGTVETLDFKQGKASVIIPGHTLVGVKFASKTVKAPKHLVAKRATNWDESDLKSTVVDHGMGKGIVIQLSPEKYFGYVYVTHKPDKLKKLTMTYHTGTGKAKKLITETYPFEFIVEVADAGKPLYYKLLLEGTDGSLEEIEERMLQPN